MPRTAAGCGILALAQIPTRVCYAHDATRMVLICEAVTANHDGGRRFPSNLFLRPARGSRGCPGLLRYTAIVIDQLCCEPCPSQSQHCRRIGLRWEETFLCMTLKSRRFTVRDSLRTMVMTFRILENRLTIVMRDSGDAREHTI